VVLDGAKAFALPTKYGQNLIVEEGNNRVIQWTSYDSDQSIWFEDTIPFDSIIRKERHDDAKSVKNTLIEILHEAYLMNSDLITSAEGYKISTELTFPKLWGLGTSSTLINNIAQWLQIDAFELLKRSFGGSGYDIACAQNNSGILYQIIDDKPVVEIVDFNPDFKDKIFFIYLNKKQNSRNAIASYYSNQVDIRKTIPVIDNLTKTVVAADEPKTFALALSQHEIALSNILELPTVKEILFHDFEGVIKSLGAWGGDFVLSISKENPTRYFNERGFDIVIPYQKMIL
jgi:hypothetical protein